MTIKDLQCFLKVSEEKSISHAAESLYMSPQGVSKVIQRLEEELQITLLTRTNNGVQLTDYGENFLPHARNMVDEYCSSYLDLERLKNEKKGILRLASAFGVLRYLSPELLHEFTHRNRDIHLDYMEFPDSYVEQELLDQNYDIALLPYQHEDPDLVYIPLFSKEICFIAHSDSAFYEASEVSIRDIMAEPLTIESDSFVIHHIISDTADKEGADFQPYFNTSGFSLCYKLLREHEANTVSMPFIFDDMKSDDARLIPLQEHPQWNVALVYRKGEEVSEMMQKFVDFVTEWCGTLD